MNFDEFLEKVHAKKIEDYSSMRSKDKRYISMQRYRNYVTDTVMIGSDYNVFSEFDNNHITMNYKINGKDGTSGFKSILDLNRYTGRDYHDILNSGINKMPVIKSGNGEGFDLSVEIPGNKHITLTVPSNRCTVSKCNRLEIYSYNKEETDWENLLEVYQLYSDGYCYINNNKRSRYYEHTYLNGTGTRASSFINKKNMTGELYLDMNPKYICWMNNGDTLDAEFKIEYDKSGIVKNIYGLKSTPYKDKPYCKYYIDSKKNASSFHLMLFDPFNFDNFINDNWNIWVLEVIKLDLGSYIYDRFLFWIDKDKVFNNIDQLDF